MGDVMTGTAVALGGLLMVRLVAVMDRRLPLGPTSPRLGCRFALVFGAMVASLIVAFGGIVYAYVALARLWF